MAYIKTDLPKVRFVIDFFDRKADERALRSVILIQDFFPSLLPGSSFLHLI